MRYQDFGDDAAVLTGPLIPPDLAEQINAIPTDEPSSSVPGSEPQQLPSGPGFVAAPSGSATQKADVFGKNTPLILGAVALGLLGLVLFSTRSTKATPNRRRRHKRSRR